MKAGARQSILTAALTLTCSVVAVVSSLGAPLIPAIANRFNEDLSLAQWSLTLTVLAGAVTSPVLGRLGDGFRRKETMIAALATVTAGGVLAATAPGIVAFLVGRTLQGAGLGLMPLAMATARDAAPPDKARRTIAMLSVAGAAGAAAGYPISGLLATAWGLPGAYWFGTAVSLAALLAVVAVVPSSASLARPSRLDWRGAGVLSVGLAALLLGTAEGSRWGWTSSSTWVTLGAGIVVLGVWARQQLRTESPLVELRFLRHPAVLAGNICGAAVGVAMYMHVSGVSEFAQSPTSGGFGFAASTARAGLILLPFAIFMMGGSRALPMLLRLAGMSAVLAGGCITSALASAFFALFHGAIWTALVSMSLLGLGLGTTFAAIPGLIIDSIPARETGSAMGFYTVVRYVSFSVGSAMTSGIVIARESPARTPTEGGYVTVFWTATAVCLVGAILSYVSTRVSHPPAMGASSPPDEVELLEMTEGDGYLGTPAN